MATKHKRATMTARQLALCPLPENGLAPAPSPADSAIPQTTTGLTKKGGISPALLFAFLLPIRAQIAANSVANLFRLRQKENKKVFQQQKKPSRRIP